MIAILGAVLGLLGSALPEALKIWRQKQDYKQELAIMNLQIEAAEKAGEQRLEEIEIQGDIDDVISARKHDKKTDIRWIEGLRASVRPVITYAFFGLYAVVKIAQYRMIMADTTIGVDWTTAVEMIWNVDEVAIFATIISFWFGGRMMKKVLGAG